MMWRMTAHQKQLAIEEEDIRRSGRIVECSFVAFAVVAVAMLVLLWRVVLK